MITRVWGQKGAYFARDFNRLPVVNYCIKNCDKFSSKSPVVLLSVTPSYTHSPTYSVLLGKTIIIDSLNITESFSVLQLLGVILRYGHTR